jgi:hypothetical protein
MREKIESTTNLGMTVRIERVVKVCGRSKSWLEKLAQKGYFPAAVNGELLHDEVWAGLLRYEREIAERRNKANAVLVEKRSEVADEDAALKRTKRLKMEGKLVERDVVLRVWQGHITAVRQRLEQSTLPKQERESILKELATKPEEYE